MSDKQAEFSLKLAEKLLSLSSSEVLVQLKLARVNNDSDKAIRLLQFIYKEKLKEEQANGQD